MTPDAILELIAELRTDLAAERAKSANLQAALTAAGAKIGEMEYSVQQVKHLKTHLEHRDAEIARLKDESRAAKAVECIHEMRETAREVLVSLGEFYDD